MVSLPLVWFLSVQFLGKDQAALLVESLSSRDVNTMQYDPDDPPSREWYTRHEFFRSEKPRIERLGIVRDAPVAGEMGEHEL